MKSKNAGIKILTAGIVLSLTILACSIPGSSTPALETQTPVVEIHATEAPTTAAPTVVSPTSLPASPVISAPSLVRIHMFDPLNGWGLTDTNLVRTLDGGLTWVDITPPGVTSLGYSASTYFLDPLTGWMLIPGADFSTGTLVYTTDGGSNWTSTAVPFGGGQFDFINVTSGFILVDRGAGAGSEAVDVYSTSDGGASWTTVYVMQPGAGENVNTLPFGGQKSGFAFLDSSHAWVGGNIPMDGYIYLYHSLDGGRTWAKQDPLLPAGFETAMTEAMTPRFFSAVDGILPVRLLAGESAFDFYVTHDSGATWTSTLPVNSNGQYSIVSPEGIIVWDGGPVLLASYDGGLSWNPVPTNVNVTDTLSMFQFVDPLTGWLLTGDAANHHSLYKTVDGGATWNVLIP
jgi:photosystem II stability/assembly factor-like uncharacterized protein